MPKRKRGRRRTYPQNWPVYNAAKTNEKRHFRVLLREVCRCVKQPKQDGGRPRLPIADVIFAIVYKTYNKRDGRRSTGDAEDARDLGFLGRVPHFNSQSRYLREEWLTEVFMSLIELASLPLVPYELDFAADATGFSTDGYKRWVDARTLPEPSSREWVKLHLISGVKTHVVTAAIVSWGHESQFFGRLVAATRRNFRMEEVSADAGYISGENMRHALLVGATPYIAFRSDCRLDADYKSEIWKRMLAMFQNEHGRFLAHYNKRNNVETTFSMIKSHFDDRVRGRDDRARVNEVLAKVLCHNLCVLIQSIYELGLEPKFEAVIDPDNPAGAPEEPKSAAGGRIVVAPPPTAADFGGQGTRGKRGRRREADPNQLSLSFPELEERSEGGEQPTLF